jgi:hypothetical protein
VGGSYEVPAAELTESSVVRFTCERRTTLVLADLTGAALKSLGLHDDISASADYSASRAWARAIHGASPRWDGIRYVSRQMNKGLAFAIFECSGLRKPRAEKRKARHADDLCDRFDVTTVRPGGRSMLRSATWKGPDVRRRGSVASCSRERVFEARRSGHTLGGGAQTAPPTDGTHSKAGVAQSGSNVCGRRD